MPSPFQSYGRINVNEVENMRLVIDNNTLEKYEQFYFRLHPKATKRPIDKPIHPLLNQWMIMKRPMMNALKQRWKDFIVWFIKEHVCKCEMKFTTYYKTNRRHDVDAASPKFILDGFTESGFIIDDDSTHLISLTLECYVDKEYPRTEIEITNIKLKEN